MNACNQENSEALPEGKKSYMNTEMTLVQQLLETEENVVIE